MSQAVAPSTTPALDAVLAQVSVVLVRPRSPGNVGATARAMANQGLGRLAVVAPPAFDPDVARWMAPGAHDRIDNALYSPTLAHALDTLGVVRVVATSARARRIDTPVWDPPALAAAVHNVPQPTAIVFGPEDFGLDNAALSRCDAVLQIPTGPHRSLNLSQAVNITAAWLRLAQVPESVPAPPSTEVPAGLRAGLINDLVSLLHDTTYFSGRSLTATRARVTASLARLQLDAQTAAMARGMLKAVHHRLRTQD